MKQVVAMGCSGSWERKVYFRTDWLLTYVHSSVVSKRKKNQSMEMIGLLGGGGE